MKNSILQLRSLNKNSLFWILNVGGWLGISILTFIYDRSELVSWHYFYMVYTYYFLGFMVTILLRRFYKSRLKHFSSIHRFLYYIILSALLSSLIIYILHSILCIPLYLKSDLPSVQQSQILKDFFLRTFFTANMLIIFLIICAWSTLYLGINFWLNLREELVRSNQVQLMARNAQLEMLRYQLNPHFLFNSLNSIWALADDDPKATKSMINELSEFLRYSLLSNDKTFNPLEYELDALKNYFAIEKRRYQNNLFVELDIDPETKEIPVISFLIQPFVENAIKFGMKTSRMPLRIKISTKKILNGLKIIIYNTGHWIDPDFTGRFDDALPGTGIGLDNIIKRLEIVYPGQHKFFIEKESSFVRVNIEISNDHDSKRV
jgi:two-component system LytT family sensor kinase